MYGIAPGLGAVVIVNDASGSVVLNETNALCWGADGVSCLPLISCHSYFVVADT